LPEMVTQTLPAKRKQESSNGVTNKLSYTPTNLVKMLLEGKSYRDIADYYGKDVSTIHKNKAMKAYRKLLEHPEEIEAYLGNEAQILRVAAGKFLSRALDEEKLKKMSSRDAVVNTGILIDKYRLLSGQSTDNFALHVIIEKIERDEQKRRGGPQDVVDGTLEP